MQQRTFILGEAGNYNLTCIIPHFWDYGRNNVEGFQEVWYNAFSRTCNNVRLYWEKLGIIISRALYHTFGTMEETMLKDFKRCGIMRYTTPLDVVPPSAKSTS